MKIGISLSGGGAKGIAHIGVLQALIDYGIEIDMIAGTSAGAIVGALFAAGIPPSEMLKAIRNTSYLRIFGLQWPNRGLGDMAYLTKLLGRMIPVDSFAGLKLPLYVTLTNLNSGTVEIRNRGPLFNVIGASCSVPLLFKPVEIDGSHYLDGGIGMNMPVRCLVGKCDLIVGVNLVNHHSLGNEYLASWRDIMSRVFDLSVYNNVKPEMDLCDIVIEPIDIHLYSRFNFNQAEQLYKAGYEGAMLKIQEILGLVKNAQQFPE